MHIEFLVEEPSAEAALNKPERNRSHSFQIFRQGLLELIR